MGLSSSQGRLLLLTSRMSDIEFSEILIAQNQQMLAMDKEKITKEYNEAMNNYTITIKVPDSETGKTTKERLNYINMTAAGYLLTNNDVNKIYLKKKPSSETQEGEGQTTADEWEIPKDSDNNDLFQIIDGKAFIGGKYYEIADGTDIYNNQDKMINLIMYDGVKIIKIGSDSTSTITGITASELNSDTNMERILDTTDDAAAESKYEYELAKLERADNMLDLEMKQLETQHEAVSKEYESVKKVISNNIDRTFNLFSNG